MDSCALALVGLFALAFFAALSEAGTPKAAYLLPPPEIVQLFDSNRVPAAFLQASPGGHWLLESDFAGLSSIEDFPDDEIGLAGRIVDGATNAGVGLLVSNRFSRLSAFDLLRHRNAKLPAVSNYVGRPLWAPNGARFAFMRRGANALGLWIVNMDDMSVREVKGAQLNTARATPGPIDQLPCNWSFDSRKLLCLLIPQNRGNPPIKRQDLAPSVQTTDVSHRDRVLRVKYEQYLHTVHDEALYVFFMTSQPAEIDAATGSVTAIARPGIYKNFLPSPDGRYILSLRIEPPYSHETFDDRFPSTAEVLDSRGKLLRTIARSAVDMSGDWRTGAAPIGPRQFFWQPTEPSTLAYFDSLDGGDPVRKSSYRDRLLALQAPFNSRPAELFRSRGRMGQPRARVFWGEGGLLIAEECDYDGNRVRAWKLDSRKRRPPELLWDYSSIGEDAANVNGEIVTQLGPNTGRESNFEARNFDGILLQDGDWIYLRGNVAPASDDRPFLERFNVVTHKRERLFESASGAFEEVVSVLDTRAERLLTRVQNPRTPPNYRIVDRRSAQAMAVTHYQDPTPQITRARRETLNYVRSDGLPLRGELYYPTDYRVGERPPLIMWGYPALANEATWPSQSNIFPSVPLSDSPLALVTQGYAVFHAAMPLTGGNLANDTMNEQLAANAQAAINKLAAMGLADRTKIGVVGHSFGGFMVANLLENTRLFAAGVAFSGVYNLTLTPNDVQNETRSYWNAPTTFDAMSPFRNADRIEAPLLLVHGQDDESIARLTQSEGMFEALVDLHKVARLVTLPKEGHTFQARETLLDAQAEMLAWFDKFVKRDAKARKGPAIPKRAFEQ